MSAPADDDTTTVAAAVWTGGRDIEVRRLPAPDLAPGEILVGIDLATVCGSDRHTVAGRRTSPAPGILGHEGVGRVAALGVGGATDLDGRALQVGDRIVWSVVSACDTCDRCRGGHTAKCRTLMKVGHEPLEGPWPLSGTYATHLVLPNGHAVVVVPATVSDAAASIAGCALATVCACLEAAGPIDGQVVLVSGLGALGICATALASHSGADAIIGIDPDPARRALALEFGATVAHPPDDAALDAIEPDTVIELSGAATAVRAAIQMVAVGGTVVLAGSVAPAGDVAVDPEQLVRNLTSIVGVHNYEPRHLRAAVDFLASGSGASFDRLVDAPVGLGDLTSILHSEAGATGRASVAPG